MSVVSFGQTLTEMRNRRGWQQERLLDMLSFYAPVLHRIEKGELLPRSDSLQVVLDTLGAPMKELIGTHAENLPIAVSVLCHNLIQALDIKDPEAAQSFYDELSATKGFDGEINQQFLLCQKARLLELQGKPDNIIMPLVLEGIKQTFDGFDENSPGDKILIFEEPELFHTLARLHARNGRLHDAIRILTDTRKGLQRLPTGARERDKRFIPILLSLADCQLKAGAYEDALDTCDLGYHSAAIRSAGQGMPDFLLNRAIALLNLGRGQECKHILTMAYTGYLLLGEKEKADYVLGKSQDEFGISFNTYGMDALDIPPVIKMPYARGKIPVCDNIGAMIRILRKEAGLGLKELSEGICSAANLSRIEKNKVHGHMHLVEPILQRLGRDPLLYCNFFLNKKDFEARELQDLIHLLLITGNHDQAAEALEKLKTYDAYKSGVNLQFVLRAEASLFSRIHGAGHPEREKKLLDALALTWDDFNEDDINRRPLSHVESIIIYGLAGYYMTIDDLRRAAKIYEALIENLNRRYVDEHEKARMYASTMFDYSSCLGRMGRRIEAMEIIMEAEDFDRSRGALVTLPALAWNKAYNLYESGEKEKALAYFAMGYYGLMLFEHYGQATRMSISQSVVEKNYGFTMD